MFDNDALPSAAHSGARARGTAKVLPVWSTAPSWGPPCEGRGRISGTPHAAVLLRFSVCNLAGMAAVAASYNHCDIMADVVHTFSHGVVFASQHLVRPK